MARNRTYGYDPVAMSRNLTVAQLEQMIAEVREQHAVSSEERAQMSGMESLYLIDKKGRWKIDQITWAIYYLTKD